LRGLARHTAGNLADGLSAAAARPSRGPDRRIRSGAIEHPQDRCLHATGTRLTLARRSISGPAEIAYYVCYRPAAARMKDLVRTAGAC
jgi:hypothetical protein